MRMFVRLLMNRERAACVVLALCAPIAFSFAQVDLRLPRISQRAQVRQTIGITDIAVTYHRPGVKGRTIWGGLVPYNQVWRAGANEATTISFSEKVFIAGKTIPAGTYSLFIIPAEREWTFILNSRANQWGAFTYSADLDVHRFTALPTQAPFEEWLRYEFSNLTPSAAMFVLHWGTMRVGFAITADAPAGTTGREVRVSPGASVSQRIGMTDCEVTYHRPGVKGRSIWGSLVPYGKVWRAGANEATTISFSTDVLIAGRTLEAGTYSFFAIPEPNKWTLIFNSVAQQWGAFSYDSTKDVMRLQVKPEPSETQEWLEYMFDVPGESSARLSLRWQKIAVRIPIETDTRSRALGTIRHAIDTASAGNWSVFLTGARYCLESGFNFEEAIQWIERSIGVVKNFSNVSVYAQLQARIGDTAAAVTAAKDALAIAERTNPRPNTSAIERLLATLQQPKEQ